MNIYCCGCQKTINAKLITGADIYPHRDDLHKLPFWRCVMCGNYVGCHHKTKNRTRPLGVIPTKEIRNARHHLHALIDPIWKCGKMKRKEIYRRLSERLGYVYHTGETKSLEQCREVYRAALEITPVKQSLKTEQTKNTGQLKTKGNNNGTTNKRN